ARRRLDIEQAQLRDLVGLAHQEYRADDPAVTLRHPGLLAARIEIPGEAGEYLGDKRLERAIPAMFLIVDHALASGDPADVSDPVWPQHEGRSYGWRLDQPLDLGHRGGDPFRRSGWQRADKPLRLFRRGAIEFAEGGEALLRQAEQRL